MGDIKELICKVYDSIDEGRLYAMDVIDECAQNGDDVEVDIKPFFQMGGTVFLFQITIRNRD